MSGKEKKAQIILTNSRGKDVRYDLDHALRLLRVPQTAFKISTNEKTYKFDGNEIIKGAADKNS